MNQEAALGAFCVAGAGVLWGVLGLFVRALGESGLLPLDVVGVRAIVTALALLIFLLVRSPGRLAVRLRDVWCFVGTGICSIVFFNLCYFTAVRMMSLASAAVLLYTAPAFVMVLSRLLFGEQLTRRRLAALLAAFLGCVSVTGVFGAQPELTALGVAIGLGAGLGYALYTIFSRYALARGYDAVTITFYTFLFSAVCVLLIGGATRIAAAAADPAACALMVTLGLVSTVAPFLLYTYGLTRLSGARASIIASIEPVTAALLGVVCYGERLSAQTLLGLLLVLLGIFIARKA